MAVMNKPPFNPNAPFKTVKNFDEGGPVKMAQGGSVKPPFNPNQSFTPADQVDPSDKPAFDPNKPYQDAASAYGTLPQVALTALEQTASGATLGASKKLETYLGVPPEDIKRREDTNKITSFLSNALGTGALIYATGGMGGAAEGAGLAGEASLTAAGLEGTSGLLGTAGNLSTAAKIGLGGVEGSIIGGVNEATDDWSQNKALDAQKIAAAAGIGGLLGVAGTGIDEGISAYRNPIVKINPSVAEAAENAGAPPPPGTPPPPPASMPGGVAAGVSEPAASIEQAAERLANARKFGNLNTDRPQGRQVMDALTRLDLGEATPTGAQEAAILNPAEDNDWNLQREMGGKTGDIIRGTESWQRQVAATQLENDLKELNGGVKAIEDPVSGGNATNDILAKRFREIEESTKPALQAIRDAGVGSADHLGGVVEALTEGKNNNLSNMFDTSGADIEVLPFSDKMKINHDTYKSVAKLVKSLQDGNTSLEDLMHYRNIMGNSTETITPGGVKSLSEIGALKAKLMTYIENYTQQFNPELQVREPLKAWAINKGYQEAIEGMGASVGKPEMGVKSNIIPEDINKNIFKNSTNVNTVKRFLGSSQEFNKIAANHIAQQKAAFTKDGTLSSARFKSWLGTNKPELDAAIGDSPKIYQHINDLATFLHGMPDAKSVNPPHTARTFMAMAKNLSLYPPDAVKEIGQHALAMFKEKAEERAVIARLNAQMASKTATNAGNETIKSGVKKVSTKLETGIKALFQGAASNARKF